jgi:xylulokinase
MPFAIEPMTSTGPDVLLGIDAGTSAVKVCAVAPDGRIVAKAQRAVPVVTPLPLWAEIDLERYWSLLCEAMREVTARCGPVRGIGLATTCPTTIVLDAEDRPLRPGIVYLDGRADALLQEKVGGNPVDYCSRTGNRASTSTAWAANLAWLHRREAALWARVRRVTTLNGFLAQRLAGRGAIDPTQASYSGLMDVRASAAHWSPELLDFWGIDPALLPPIVPCASPVGEVTRKAAAETGLAEGTALAAGAADTAAAAFAVGLREAGDAFESVGTSGVITFCLDRPTFDASFLNRHHVLPGRWLAHGAMSTLGGAFGWLQGKVFPEVRSFAELENLALSSVPGANGLVFLPYLAGERSPVWDAEASGAWIGLRLHHSRADMVRAVFEGGALALRQILQIARERWGYRPARLVGVGGGARSRFWAQVKADVLGLDYHMASVTDASAIGAAMLGGVAAGVYRGVDDPALPTIRCVEKPVQPGPAERRAVYDRHFEVFDALYPALAPAMHALGRHPADAARAGAGAGSAPPAA